MNVRARAKYRQIKRKADGSKNYLVDRASLTLWIIE